MSYTPTTVAARQTAQQLAQFSRTLYERGWMPGTAGNLSMRVPRAPGRALITASGRDKGDLRIQDMVEIDAETGRPSPGQDRASAETSLHAALYRTTDAQAVIHVHSPHATAVAHRAGLDGATSVVHIERYELLKGLGLDDPAAAKLPVFPNWARVDRIAEDIAAHVPADPGCPPGLLIADHGITVWGQTLGQARNRLECLEALCQLLVLSPAGLNVTRVS
ncbi:methylthioribulose 1-phosphate dehydratase [Streptomyces enissocaesilis]|uniref:Methylthioribulose-1-phosphate dehydratase n=1 Tax=Streptomyces enissocaesilis TaxID=332589 RepID=A0ABP6JIX6_9ACTN